VQDQHDDPESNKAALLTKPDTAVELGMRNLFDFINLRMSFQLLVTFPFKVII
jgi:hypothetical protein